MASAPLTLTTADPDETRAIGRAVAAHVRAGDAVALSGELGAGKTCFVQGAAAALGVTRRVTSPTFMLVRVYEDAVPPVVHCDVYRLDHLQDVLDLGDEVLAPDAVTFLEWGDAVTALLPDDRLDVEVLLGEDGQRRLALTAHGDWQERLAALREDCARWVDDAGDGSR